MCGGIAGVICGGSCAVVVVRARVSGEEEGGVCLSSVCWW